MANFEDWCDSTERNISDHYLQSIKARDAEFMFGVQVMAALIPEHYASSRNIAKEGANKQVISSQADSLIKISRIWADF
ncbi:hypothetical protein LRS17_23565, partial [Klebsiella pneumoniae]|nr:hypothetical protein [Klebsiella pneumoniae]